MDEDEPEIEYEEIKPRTHDRWTVLAFALDWGARVADVTANTLEIAAKATIQHGWQKVYDRKFNKITKDM